MPYADVSESNAVQHATSDDAQVEQTKEEAVNGHADSECRTASPSTDTLANQPAAIFQITVKLPHEPFEHQITVCRCAHHAHTAADPK